MMISIFHKYAMKNIWLITYLLYFNLNFYKISNFYTSTSLVSNNFQSKYSTIGVNYDIKENGGTFERTG
jgi:hypothetical protein